MKKHENKEEDIDTAKQSEVEETNEPAETDEDTTVSGTDADSEEQPGKKSKQKKAVRRRKSKKEKENPITGAIRLAVESGKVEYGAKSMSTSAKLYVVSNNLPTDLLTKIEAKAKAGSIAILKFQGSSMELGSVCGCPFPVSVLSVVNPGTSNILELVEK